MLDLYAELRRIVEALDAAGIPYALAGGLAVSIYTTPRATEDIDLLIARGDLDRAVSALQSAGFRPAGRPMTVAGGRLEIQRLTKIDGTDLLPLDLLLPADPTIAALLEDRTCQSLEGRPVWVVGLGALRALKRLRNSALDRADRGARAGIAMALSDAAAALRKVAALRALCLRLPHIPTPAERHLLRRFDALVTTPHGASEGDTETLVAGWRRWWREGRSDALFAMAERMPAGLAERDRRLASYLAAALATVRR